MTDALATLQLAVPLTPWAPQPGESAQQHLAFVWWAYHEGPIDHELADQYDWAIRAQQIQELNRVSGDPAEMVLEAMSRQVEMVIAEMAKLHKAVLSHPDSVLSHAELFGRADMLMQTIEGLRERQVQLQDYSLLTPEERDIMIEAERIQRERLA